MAKLKIFGVDGPDTPKALTDVKKAEQVIKDIDVEVREKNAKRSELVSAEADLHIAALMGDAEAIEKLKDIPPQIGELDKRIEILNRVRPKAMDLLKAAEDAEYERTKKAKWKATRKLTNSIMEKSAKWQAKAEELVKLGKEIQNESIAAYNEAPRKDTIFLDCLLAPNRIQNEFKNYLFKLSGWHFCANSIKNQHQLPIFVDQMNEACGWITKFEGREDLGGSFAQDDSAETSGG